MRRALLIVITLIIGSLIVIMVAPDNHSVKAKNNLALTIKKAGKKDQAAQKLAAESDVINSVISDTNKWINLPDKVTVVLGGSKDGPYYDPETRRIEFPWQFITETRALLKKSGYKKDEIDQAVTDTTRFILRHEIGHAVIDQLSLPIVGREEDAADYFATYAAVNRDHDGEQVIAATDLFEAYDQQGTQTLGDEDFSDNHSLDLQRFYGISCLVYGSNTRKYGSVIKGIGLDKERKESCVEEWELLDNSWQSLLQKIALQG